MAYTAIPDRRMGYDNDGTVVYYGASNAPFSGGPQSPAADGTKRIALNGFVYQAASGWSTGGGSGYSTVTAWLFFPELREVTAWSIAVPLVGTVVLNGSADSTNGVDGSWEVATLSGEAQSIPTLDGWRASIGLVSMTGPKRAIRVSYTAICGPFTFAPLHVYGRKGSGQTPDDILFLDGQTSFAEFAAPEDFGDVPLGTTTVRTFKVQNSSATKTANSINLQCNDADFAISTDNVTWVTTINIASLGAGASSSTLYIRNTAPAIGSVLGPRFARVVAIVSSWS